MKRICAVILAFALAVILSACASGKVTESEIVEQKANNKMFMDLSDEGYGTILVCKETFVLYWMSTGGNNYGALTLLVDADGKPMIWKG